MIDSPQPLSDVIYVIGQPYRRIYKQSTIDFEFLGSVQLESDISTVKRHQDLKPSCFLLVQPFCLGTDDPIKIGATFSGDAHRQKSQLILSQQPLLLQAAKFIAKDIRLRPNQQSVGLTGFLKHLHAGFMKQALFEQLMTSCLKKSTAAYYPYDPSSSVASLVKPLVAYDPLVLSRSSAPVYFKFSSPYPVETFMTFVSLTSDILL